MTSKIAKKTKGMDIDFSVFFNCVLRLRHSQAEDSFSNAYLSSLFKSSFWISLTRSKAFLPYLSLAFLGAPLIKRPLSGLPLLSYSELLTDK